MTTPAVSVVVPAYNREGTIGAAVDSVLAQTFADLEVIVVDDGSTDGTATAARGIADPRVRVLALGRNAGASQARNYGIEAATAPWVAFQDSDDIWLPRKLEMQMARLTAPGADYVAGYCGMLLFPGGPDSAEGGAAPDYIPPRQVTPREGDLSEVLLCNSLISTQTLVARRDMLLRSGGFDPVLPALIDWDLAMRLSRLGQIALVDEPLVHQFLSGNSITRSARKRLEARLRILNSHGAVLAANPGALGWHHYQIAGALRAEGEIAAAREHVRAAIVANPRNLRYRAMAVYLGLKALRGG